MKISADILIRNASFVLTMDSKRQVLENGAVAIKGNRIAAVGLDQKVTGKYKAEKVIDAAEMVVLPGLTNGHNHWGPCFGALAKGFGRIRQCEAEATDFIIPFGSSCAAALKDLGADAEYVFTMVQCLEMIKSGTTCSIDLTSIQAGEVSAQTAVDSGIRAVIAPGFADIVDIRLDLEGKANPTISLDAGMSLMKRFVRKWHHSYGDRIRAGTNTLAPMNGSAQLAVAFKQLCDNNPGMIYANEVGETLSDIEASIAKYGKSDVRWLYDIGCLGPNVLSGHNVWVSSEEIQIFKATGTKAATNVTENTRHGDWGGEGLFGEAICPVSEFIDSGVTIMFGTDGGLADGQDLWKEMFQTAGMQQYKYTNYFAMPPTKILEMSTIDGAHGLNWEDQIGSIEPGKKADIILIDTRKPHLRPFLNPPLHLVYQAKGSDVDTVIIDGKIVMEKRVIKTIDESKMLEKAQKLGEKWVQRFAEQSDIKHPPGYYGWKPWISAARFPEGLLGPVDHRLWRALRPKQREHFRPRSY